MGVGGRTCKTLCLSSISPTSTLAEFYKDQSSSESRREATFACYPTAVCHPDPTECWGPVPVAGQGCPRLPGSPRLPTDPFAQLFAPRRRSCSPAQAPFFFFFPVNYGKPVNPSFPVVIEGYRVSAERTPARAAPHTCPGQAPQAQSCFA